MSNILDKGILGPSDSVFSTSIWHYGDPFAEQREAHNNIAHVVDHSVGVLSINGKDTVAWLNKLCTKSLINLAEGAAAQTFILDSHGRIEHQIWVYHHDGTLYLETFHRTIDALEKYLHAMIFWSDIIITRRDDLSVIRILGPEAEKSTSMLNHAISRLQIFSDLPIVTVLTTNYKNIVDSPHIGLWAYEAFRIASAFPRVDIDGDDKTLPHEFALVDNQHVDSAVTLNKGCYRGQETISKIENLGNPPRRLVLLHADSSWGQHRITGSTITWQGKPVGRLGSYIDHYLLGPIALGLVKRSVPHDAQLSADNISLAIDKDFYQEDAKIPAGKAAIAKFKAQNLS